MPDHAKQLTLNFALFAAISPFRKLRAVTTIVACMANQSIAQEGLSSMEITNNGNLAFAGNGFVNVLRMHH
jgi:hypothetical protein